MLRASLRAVRQLRRCVVVVEKRAMVGMRPLVCQARPSTSRAADRYEILQPVEHILKRPDSYVGAVQPAETLTWVFDDDSGCIKRRLVSYPPGLLKIFDEILVNAADNKQRDPGMSELRVEADGQRVAVWNDGRGLPVETHSTGVLVPSLVFGSLYTSSNFDDGELRTVGGRNGYGAKLTNIFSQEFSVETASNGKVFRQTWRGNMGRAETARVDEMREGDREHTLVQFRPDLAKFGVAEMSEQLLSVMHRRCVDIAGTLRGVRVFWNGEEVEGVDSFSDYVRLYREEDSAVAEEGEGREMEEVFFSSPHPRWEVAVRRSPDSAKHVSFVNQVATTKGGRHVAYIVEQVVSAISAALLQLHPSLAGRIRAAEIRARLFVFVNCLVENPVFESQTKETLATRKEAFGSTCELNPADVVAWAERNGLLEELATRLAPSSRRARRTPIHTQPAKLLDAEWAGRRRRGECQLIVTEGDSAKALAVAGLEVVGRERFGVFPVRGKVINASDEERSKVLANSELAALAQIIGLEPGREYATEEERASLRYGSVLLLTDQDEDGAHIRGLLLNAWRVLWPRLLEAGFVHSMRTPLIKARRGQECVSFYSQRELAEWRESQGEKAGKWTLKYYKGLGTSTAAEAREYFASLDKNRMVYRMGAESEEAGLGDGRRLAMAFERDKTDDRKRWIEERIQALSSESSNGAVLPSERNMADFVDEELIHFSLLDLKRSIPSVVDGLKPSQRKVLHTVLRQSRDGEMKVNQLAGLVSQSSAYHHGEESLINTIIRLAQNYVGANNLPLLLPIGQFGTRHEGGQDAASARYIYTQINPLSRLLFPSADAALLPPQMEENVAIEPEWLCPIVPLVLVNGCEGIGTGWATSVPPHALHTVMARVRARLEGRKAEETMVPGWHGFTGGVRQLAPARYRVSGVARVLPVGRSNAASVGVEVSELPAGVWTSRYKERVLRGLQEKGMISSLSESHTHRSVLFRLTLPRKELKTRGGERERLHKMLKLDSTVGSGNMVLFDSSRKLRKFATTEEIFDEHFEVRAGVYRQRVSHAARAAEAAWQRARMQCSFVEAVVRGQVRLDSPLPSLLARLGEMGLTPDPVRQNKAEPADFSYLLDMPFVRLTEQERSKLEAKENARKAEWESAEQATWDGVWASELDTFEREYYRLEKKMFE